MRSAQQPISVIISWLSTKHKFLPKKSWVIPCVSSLRSECILRYFSYYKYHSKKKESPIKYANKFKQIPQIAHWSTFLCLLAVCGINIAGYTFRQEKPHKHSVRSDISALRSRSKRSDPIVSFKSENYAVIYTYFIKKASSSADGYFAQNEKLREIRISRKKIVIGATKIDSITNSFRWKQVNSEFVLKLK